MYHLKKNNLKRLDFRINMLTIFKDMREASIQNKNKKSLKNGERSKKTSGLSGRKLSSNKLLIFHWSRLTNILPFRTKRMTEENVIVVIDLNQS